MPTRSTIQSMGWVKKHKKPRRLFDHRGLSSQDRADSLVATLRETGHKAALVGEVFAGEPSIEVV